MIEQTAALSVDSPQSILQSAMDNVPLGGGTAVAENNAAKLDPKPKPKLTAAGLTLGLRAKSDGRAHVFAWTGTASVADAVATLHKGKTTTVTLPLSASACAALQANRTVLVSFASNEGGTESLAAPVH